MFNDTIVCVFNELVLIFQGESWNKSFYLNSNLFSSKDYAAAQLRQYQRLTRQIKPDLEQYEKLKEQ